MGVFLWCFNFHRFIVWLLARELCLEKALEALVWEVHWRLRFAVGGANKGGPE
jgi:hypothetical protein